MAACLIVAEAGTGLSRFARYAKSVDPDEVEGEFPLEQALVFERPTRQAASDLWHSDEYTEIEKLREGAAIIRTIIVEGIQFRPPGAE